MTKKFRPRLTTKIDIHEKNSALHWACKTGNSEHKIGGIGHWVLQHGGIRQKTKKLNYLYEKGVEIAIWN